MSTAKVVLIVLNIKFLKYFKIDGRNSMNIYKSE